MILKNFVVFEGIDGAGTSTQMELLKSRPEAKNMVFHAEPTERETGVFLRKVLCGEVEVSPQTAAYLFAADRAEHLYGKGGVVELCQSGKTVVCDRYIFSSLAYQGVTCGEELPALINSPFPLPEILFFFDIKTEDSLKRIEGRGEKKEIYENKKMLDETAARYRKIIEKFKGESGQSGLRVVEIDANLPKSEISDQIFLALLNK